MNVSNKNNKNPYEVQDICPEGWHVPSDAEFKILTDYLGGVYAGGKMKSTRTEPNPHPRWESPNYGATNESNWTGLPGGKWYEVNFSGVGYTGNWCSSTETTACAYAYGRRLRTDDSGISVNFEEKFQYHSVRCLRD